MTSSKCPQQLGLDVLQGTAKEPKPSADLFLNHEWERRRQVKQKEETSAAERGQILKDALTCDDLVLTCEDSSQVRTEGVEEAPGCL